ncbi:Transcriptional Activator SRCAP-Like Protein [Streptomyces leeuwenhoekii]|uniref:Transcriptional Activator SRCAP-Like Protein n=1 Tax=Streptomyces leeuwenhoekii TaxID=1437453 RepID=A0A0F7VQ57_STRLW|nr:Transcriptional Activator SRCAP-Like Protein [Streptomyces leeuwenhoekii]
MFGEGPARLDAPVCDQQALAVGGQVITTASPSPVPVRVTFTVDGETVTGTLVTVDLGGDRALVLVDGVPADSVLPAGAWALADGRALRLARRTPAPPADPGRLDGLGRALPAVRPRAGTVRDRTVQALVTDNGIFTPRPGPTLRKGMRILEAPSVRGWSPIGEPGGENGLSVDFYSPPLRIAGALTALPAPDPYEAVVGGVLLVDTGAFNGSAMGAYVVPGSGAQPSLFAYGSLGSRVGFGPPLFQVRGISAGFGWNSRVRVPSADALGSFPFLVALDNPGEIGADDEEVDPLKVLGELIDGSNPWVRPQQGDLWFAAGLAFDCFESFRGHAMALVQTGSELTISLLGVGGTQLPTKSDKKIARIEIGIEATLRPTAGELSIGAAFTEKTFLIDPNCKLRGGVGMKFWFGNHPHAGDFALLLGAIPSGRELPARYPRQQQAGLTWGVGSTVNISGSAYAAFTPKSLMAGGSLDVVFQSGMLRAWLTARIDALLEWNPFYFDVGMGVRVGVSATIKVWFVKIRISVEIGVSVRVWGPAVGGEATVHLWFISFTIGFGADHRAQTPALDWDGFKDMLPPPENMVRTTAIAGYTGEGAPATRGAVKPWLVSSGGFTFTADTQAPVSRVFLDQNDSTPVATGSAVDILPMHVRGKGSELRVWLTYNGQAATLTRWGRAVLRGNVPNGLWGEQADAPNDGIIPDRILGIRLTSPPVDYGTDTGFIDEEAISFDPINPDGNVPLYAGEPATGAVPTRPGGVIAAIHGGIDTFTTRDNRATLAQALAGLGAGLGTLDGDLSAYAQAAGTAFTAEPMLVAG